MELTANEARLIVIHRDHAIRDADRLLMELHASNLRLRNATTDVPHDQMTAILQTIADATAWIAKANGEVVVPEDTTLPLVMKRF